MIEIEIEIEINTVRCTSMQHKGGGRRKKA